MVGVLQMVSSAGFYVLSRTIDAARCRVPRIGVDVQQALECNSMCIAGACSGRCFFCNVVMFLVVVRPLGLVSVYSINDAASMLLLAYVCTGRCSRCAAALVAVNHCAMKAAPMYWNGRSSVRMSAYVCG